MSTALSPIRSMQRDDDHSHPHSCIGRARHREDAVHDPTVRAVGEPSDQGVCAASTSSLQCVERESHHSARSPTPQPLDEVVVRVEIG